MGFTIMLILLFVEFRLCLGFIFFMIHTTFILELMERMVYLHMSARQMLMR
jgi:hypothetical protein